MALLKIARMGHPLLVARASEVVYPWSSEIHRLVSDMIETMEDAGGVGLAAPQVFVSLRLFVYRVPNAGSIGAAQAIINPSVEPIGDEKELGWEGCLSIPGLRAAIPRYGKVRCHGQDLAGNAISFEAEGVPARIVQHEMDHLDGILMPARIVDFTQFGFDDELKRAGALTSP